MGHTVQIAIDCADPQRSAAFWCEVLGYRLQPPPEGYADWPAWLAEKGIPPEQWNNAAAAVDADGKGPRLYFQKVPERKRDKNHVHVDVSVGRDNVDPTVERLVALGATVVRPGEISPLGEYWVVLADPDGNEFCLQ
jgi:catechol 2,3-dioxygenase-like lactoylglutathione lyase family enzyme